MQPMLLCIILGEQFEVSCVGNDQTNVTNATLHPESIFASGCLRGLVCGGPGRLAVIILLDISTINSTDFFGKILRGQMGEGGGG